MRMSACAALLQGVAQPVDQQGVCVRAAGGGVGSGRGRVAPGLAARHKPHHRHRQHAACRQACLTSCTHALQVFCAVWSLPALFQHDHCPGSGMPCLNLSNMHAAKPHAQEELRCCPPRRWETFFALHNEMPDDSVNIVYCAVHQPFSSPITQPVLQVDRGGTALNEVPTAVPPQSSHCRCRG